MLRIVDMMSSYVKLTCVDYSFLSKTLKPESLTRFGIGQFDLELPLINADKVESKGMDLMLLAFAAKRVF